MPRTATRLALRAGAAATVAAVIIGGASLPANAATADATQAEGRLVSGSGAVDLDDIAAIAGSFAATAPGGAAASETDPLDLTVLNSLGVTVNGLQLLGDNGLVDVGVAGQVASTSTTSAVSAAGAVDATGAIQVGSGAPGTGATVDLGPLVSELGAQQVVSDVSVGLGALSARAEADRTFTGATTSTDYQVAGAQVSVVSPTVQQLVTTLDTTLGTTSDTVNTALGDGTGIVDAITGPLTDALNTLDLGGVVTISGTTADVTANVDLQQALSSVTEQPLVSGPVTIDLSTGTVLIDLGVLNDLPANTSVLTSATLNTAIDQAVSDILTVQLPALLTTALTDALDSAAVDVAVATDVSVAGLPVAGADITVDSTVGALLGTSDDDPVVTIDGTGVLAPVLDLLRTALQPVVDTALVPAVTTLVGDVVGGTFVQDTVTALLDTLGDTVTALDPLFDLVNQLVSITVNSQSDPTFTEPSADPTGATTVRAVRLQLLPGETAADSLATIDLATATVQADPFAGIAITDPEDGTEYTVPAAGDTTDVPVSGTAEPGATVDVVLDGDEAGTQTTTADPDGTWEVTFPGVGAGDHEATATETIGTLVSDPDAVTFAVAVAPGNPGNPGTPGTPGTPGGPGNGGNGGVGNGTGNGTGTGGGSLAFTGAELLPLMVIAGLLLAAGGGTLALRRMRRAAA